ncbi:MAG: hypothetical protein Kow0037_00850 [Calditrichia bacterium]
MNQKKQQNCENKDGESRQVERIVSCDYDNEYDLYDECPKCGRYYDELDYEYQICRACGWDAENKKWCKPIEPTDEDYINGEADFLTGRWY